ncbi:MAG: hypothetical protein M1827_005835 [Pycnora praestabilis]|nr:MAG: hypothetical protein M1827_005835 [Pycnora praestabilis]
MATSDNDSSAVTPPPKMDPIMRNALRYTVSAKEYKLLHQYLISRSPPAILRRAPQPPRYEAIVKSKDDYNAAAVRASLRVFLATQTGLKLWELVLTKVSAARGQPQTPKPRTSFWKSPNIRLSLSLSLILLLHRLLHRFFVRLRSNLLTDDAKPFRRRNPRISKVLCSRLAPAVGASLAGFCMGVYPADQLRITIALYAAARAAEFVFNALEDEGWFKDRPWVGFHALSDRKDGQGILTFKIKWFGSWMLMPLSAGQLLHAFVLDRDCFPKGFGDFLLKYGGPYVQIQPQGYPAKLTWPDTYEIVDGLKEITNLKWPPFISPILFPASTTLPRTLTAIAPITDPAHPAIKSLSCALLHPTDPSCLRVYLTYYIQTIPRIAKGFTLIFSLLSLPRYKSFLANPILATDKLARSILRFTFFISGALGTSWGSICLFQHVFPRTLLYSQRWFLGGFLGGLWGFLDRKNGRSNFLYSARLSVDSLWKVGVKHGWWKGIRGGDVWLFTLALCAINIVHENDPKAVNGKIFRQGMSSLCGEAVDRALGQAQNLDEVQKVEEREVKVQGINTPLKDVDREKS